jgi:chaperone BCS1
MVDREMKQGRRVSMAALQGTFIRNGAEEAVSATKELFVKR